METTPQSLAMAIDSVNRETQYNSVTLIEKGRSPFLGSKNNVSRSLEQPFIEVTWQDEDLTFFIPVSSPFSQYCQTLYGSLTHMYPAHLLLNAMSNFSRKDAFDKDHMSKWTRHLHETMQNSLCSLSLSFSDGILISLIGMIGEVTDYPYPDGAAMGVIPKIENTFRGYIERIEPEHHTIDLPSDNANKVWTVDICLTGCRGIHRYIGTPVLLHAWLLEETAKASGGVSKEAMEKDREAIKAEEYFLTSLPKEFVFSQEVGE